MRRSLTRCRPPGELTTRKGAQHLQGLKPGCQISVKLLHRVELCVHAWGWHPTFCRGTVETGTWGCLCTCCIFCQDPWHPTLFLQHSGIDKLLEQCRNTCTTPTSPWSNPQACTWPSWSFLLVSVRSNSNREKLRQKSLPGSWVLASQTDKASFQLVFFSCEVCVCICVFKCIIKQRCKAAVVKQAELFKLCEYNRATGVTQYGKYRSRKPFLCPFCASLSYLK